VFPKTAPEFSCPIFGAVIRESFSYQLATFVTKERNNDFQDKTKLDREAPDNYSGA